MPAGPALNRAKLSVLHDETAAELARAVLADEPRDRIRRLARLERDAAAALELADEGDEGRLARRMSVATRRALTANGATRPGNVRGSRTAVRGGPAPRVVRRVTAA